MDVSWNASSQGIVMTFTIPVDCDEISHLVNISQMLSEFVFNGFSKFFKKYDFCSKFETPMVLSEKDNLRLYMCFVSDDSQAIREELKNLGIEERNYV